MRMGAPQQVAFLRRPMAGANSERIVAIHKLTLYCGFALMYDEDFSLESLWPEVLAQIRAGLPFSNANYAMGV